MTSWSPQQEAALKAVSRWIKDKKANQVFRLFGYAGTGKTTLAREFREQVKGRVKFGAFTGKAALVLRSKGCVGASTIHSMIYKLQDEIGGQPRFVLDQDSPVKDAKLVIIDECSMVDEELGRDLLSFGVKILVLGDPAQLPPVMGAGFFTNATPDIMLTEVHRQARENPIIHLSMKVRSGDRLDYGSFGDSRIVSREDISPDDVIAHDQVLVGMNKTRRMYNDRIREIKGKDSGLPLPGDRLVCLRNNREKGLLNGGIWSVGEVLKMRRNAIEMRLLPEDAGVTKSDVVAKVHTYFFEGREGELAREVRRESDEFDYGYALTVHKSQGSQWGSVMLFDQSQVFREDASRHLYTGLTRAAQRITVVM